MANSRIKRDLEDRLLDRVEETKERMAAEDPNAKTKRERAEAFRDKWQNSALPDIPGGTIPGFHLCWLSTTNNYDSRQTHGVGL